MLDDGRGIVVEVVPKDRFALHANLLNWSGLRQFCLEEGYGLLVTDGRIAIQALMKRTVPPALRDAVADALEQGPLFWSEYKQIRERHQATLEDFVAMVLQDRLVWSLLPFTLKSPPLTEQKMPLVQIPPT